MKKEIPMKLIPTVLLLVALAIAVNITKVYMATTSTNATATTAVTSVPIGSQNDIYALIGQLVSNFKIEEFHVEGGCAYIRGYEQFYNYTIHVDAIHCNRTLYVLAKIELPH
jgi:hypothetical protein